MNRPLLFSALLLTALFAGCVEETPEDDLRDVFGKPNVRKEGNMTLVTADAIEGRIVAGSESNATWGNASHHTIMVPTLTLAKADPGPQGGGGVETSLDFGAANATIEARLVKGDRLASYQARWAVLLSEDDQPNWSAPQSASATYVHAIAGPGTYFTVAQLSKDGAVAGLVIMPYTAMVDAQWTVESSVFPLDPAATGPPPSNYEKMADLFFLDLPAGGTLEATTAYRGTYMSGSSSGTDVDLGVFGPDVEKCAGAGGSTQPPGPNPEQAKETVSLDVEEAGAWTVRVGSIPDSCGGMAVGPATLGYSYTNAGMVPYTVTIVFSFAT